MASAKRWAIVGNCGLYVGQELTRAAAIAKHVHDGRLFGEPEVSRWAIHGILSPDQRAIWRRCRKNGDRAVKVTITWDEPSND